MYSKLVTLDEALVWLKAEIGDTRLLLSPDPLPSEFSVRWILRVDGRAELLSVLRNLRSIDAPEAICWHAGHPETEKIGHLADLKCGQKFLLAKPRSSLRTYLVRNFQRLISSLEKQLPQTDRKLVPQNLSIVSTLEAKEGSTKKRLSSDDH